MIPQSDYPPAEGRPPHIPSLDGLRAVSILIVFLSHAGLRDAIPGTFGVTVFFFLSGYLITTLLRHEWDTAGSISLYGFYLRRTFRILPPLYITLVLANAIALLKLIPAHLTWTAFLAQCLFLANYYKIAYVGVGVAPGMLTLWSLAVEEHFYLVFPLVYILFRRAKMPAARQVGWLAAVCAVVLAWRYILVFIVHVDLTSGSQGWHRMSEATDTRLDGILMGCMLAIYGNPVLTETKISERTWKNVLLPLGVACLLFTFVYRGSAFRETLRYTLQGIAMVPIFVAAIRWPDWSVFQVLNHPWVKRLGVISYTFYLVHDFLIKVFEHVFGGVTLQGGILAFAASLAFSQAMHRFVELPATAYRKRLMAAREAASREPMLEEDVPSTPVPLAE